MNTGPNNPANLAYADPVKWPIQIRQSNYGWTVTCYNNDGHARHILTVNTEMEAYREAYSIAKTYRVGKPVLVTTDKGVRTVDLEKLLKSKKR